MRTAKPSGPEHHADQPSHGGGGGPTAQRGGWRPHVRLVVFLGLLLPLAVAFVIVAAVAPRATSVSTPIGYVSPGPPPKGAEIVYVGIEPLQIDSISLASGTFQASFYLWWRWRGSLDPTSSTLVKNASSQSSSNYATLYTYMKSGVETPESLGHDTFYQGAQVTVGVSNPFSVSRFPLDDQTLQIEIENNYEYDDLVFVPDTANMSPRPDFDVSGWSLDGTAFDEFVHTYGTNFGETSTTTANTALDYEIQISRPFSHFLMKLFLPMFIVLLAGISALFVKSDDFDVRLAMAGTGLLTLIFLQQGYAGDLPSTAPVVLMDEIYALAYAAVGATFLRVVFTTARLHHEGGSADMYAKTDHLMAVMLAFGFVVGSTLLVLL